MAVTLKDVANAVGVSTSTASRALSGTRRVSPELVARVSAAADSLGYRHNIVAQALRKQQTLTVGMVVPEINNPFFPALVAAVERILEQSGRELFLCDAQQDIDVERRRVRALLGRQIDGLIISPYSVTGSTDIVAEAREQVPVVQLDRFVDGSTIDWVGVDDEAGIGSLVKHVANLGAKTCVFISARQNSSSGTLRYEAFHRATTRENLRSAHPPLLGEFTIDWGRQAVSTLDAAKARPDAIICGNDEIALGVLRELRRRQIRIADDVLVTGFDDTGFAEISEPPLTTVRQPREQMAAEAIRLLKARTVDRKGPAQRIALAPRLIARESTGSQS